VSWRGLALVLACGSAAASPRFEDALQRAAAANKPLVVELSATWCGPCRNFERDVLANVRVRSALYAVEWVQYDIDEAPGDAVAARYHASGVPAFLVIGSDGRELARHDGAGDIAWFLRFLANAQSRVASTTELERAAAGSLDPTPHLVLARHYRAIGRIDDAIAELRKILALPNLDRAVAASTTLLAVDLAAAEARVRTAVADAIAFVGEFPESPLASGRLAFLVETGRVDATRLADLVLAHLGAVGFADLPDAVRVAALAGHADEARLAITRLGDSLPAHLLDAEIALVADPRRAVDAIEKLCTPYPAGHELQCYDLELAVTRRMRASIASDRLRSRARAYLGALEEPGRSDDSETLSGVGARDPAFGNAVAKALAAARASCARHARTSTFTLIQIHVDRFGATSAHAYAGDANKPLATCLEAALARLPRPSSDDTVFAEIVVEPAEPTARSRELSPEPVLRPTDYGVLAFAIGRAGAVDMAGIGGVGRVQLVHGRDLDFVAFGGLEVGGRDSPTYDVRGLVGLARVRESATLVAGVGIGKSRYSDAVPDAIDVPLELRVELPVTRGLRADLWGRAAWVIDTSRQRAGDTPATFFAPDEVVVGAGALVRRHVFVGAALEHRVAGFDGLVVVGTPLGSY
jgi:hypothetical protein